MPPTDPAPMTVVLTGRIFQAVFKTDVDLGQFVPAPLEVPDPHHGLVKVYQLRMRREGSPQPLPKYSQYKQVCLTVAAAPRALPTMHYNLLLWDDRDWAAVGPTPFGWRKKVADIELSWVFPGSGRFDRDPGFTRFDTEIYRYGDPIMRLESFLNAGSLQFEEPPFGGFYSVHKSNDEGVVPRVSEALVFDLDFEDLAFGSGGTVKLSAVPDDPPAEADLMTKIGEAEIVGCSLRNVFWRRTPANDRFVA